MLTRRSRLKFDLVVPFLNVDRWDWTNPFDEVIYNFSAILTPPSVKLTRQWWQIVPHRLSRFTVPSLLIAKGIHSAFAPHSETDTTQATLGLFLAIQGLEA